MNYIKEYNTLNLINKITERVNKLIAWTQHVKEKKESLKFKINFSVKDVILSLLDYESLPS